uniref:(California timema) hypothetical protein n=1 Tax=Timema californicum TaxID=61474 RepID=A0A7R9J900_TIMCA|nr:unnamed protein product [Timema californicum]
MTKSSVEDRDASDIILFERDEIIVYTQLGSNLDLPVICSLVYCKSSALDQAATEAVVMRCSVAVSSAAMLLLSVMTLCQAEAIEPRQDFDYNLPPALLYQLLGGPRGRLYLKGDQEHYLQQRTHVTVSRVMKHQCKRALKASLSQETVLPMTGRLGFEHRLTAEDGEIEVRISVAVPRMRRAAGGNVKVDINPSGGAVAQGHATVYDGSRGRLDVQGVAATRPLAVSGGAQYTAPNGRGQAVVGVSRPGGQGTQVGVEGRATLWSSPSGAATVTGNAGWGRTYGGPYGTGRAQTNVGLNFQYRPGPPCPFKTGVGSMHSC